VVGQDGDGVAGGGVGGGGLCKESRRVPDTLPSVDLAVFLRTALNGQLISFAAVKISGIFQQKSSAQYAVIGVPHDLSESKLSFKRCDGAVEKQTLKILGNALITYVSMCVNLNAETFRL